MENLHAQRKLQVPTAQLQQVDRDFAGVFRVAPSELERMFQVIRTASAEIQAIEGEMRKHANDRARWELPADRNTIRTLHERRQSAVRTNMSRLQTTLTAAGWAAVSQFINTDLRNATTIAQPSGAKP